MSFSRRYSSIKFYSPRKYRANPLFQKRRKKIRRVSLKTKLLLLLAALLAGGIIWLLFFNGYFSIDNVIINGSQRIATGKIYDIIDGQLQQKRLFFFPERNIFVFSKRQAKNEILKNFFVTNLKIKKKLPRTITINFSENDSAAVWAEEGGYYYIDNNLIILSPVENLTLTGNLLILKNIPQESGIKSEGLTKKITVGEEYFRACLSLTNKLQNILTIDSVCEVNKPEGEVRFNVSANGPKIHFSAEEDLEKQLKKLEVLLADKVPKDKLAKLEYIDLRFGDKVYYK